MKLNCLVSTFPSLNLTPVKNFFVGTCNIANKTLSFIVNANSKKGIIMENTGCSNGYIIDYLSLTPKSLCKDSSKIINIISNHLILEPAEITNNTTVISGEKYDIAVGNEFYSTLISNNLVEFLGLQNCSTESIIETLKQLVIGQIPTTITATTTEVTDYPRKFFNFGLL